jgi:4-amino-4-deoxy-L-arabinose transferase-like glycosyltransferase
MKISPTLIKILFLAILLRLALAIFVFENGQTDILFSNDSRNFYLTAQNLAIGNGFTKDITPPYEPEAHFPPLYPLLIAGSIKISGFIIPLLIIQIILASLIPLLVWKITEFFTESTKIKALASTLSAIEPLSIVFSVMVLTEIVSVFFVLLSILFFLKFMRGEFLYRHLIISGISLSLSVLTRPHGQFLLILGSGLLLLIALIKKESSKKMLVGLATFVFFFMITMSPWLIRNYLAFGTTSVSTTGLRNIYTSIVPAITSMRDNIPFETAQEIAYEKFEEKYGYNRKDIIERPELGKILAKEGFTEIKENKKITAQVFLIAFNAFFTQDLYYSYGVRFGLIPRFSIDFSPSVVLLKEGPVVLFNKIKDSVGFYGLIPFSGRLFWIFVNILALIGFAYGVKNKDTRFMTIFFAILILYYAGTSSIAAFSDHGRFRFPATGFMYILAGFGLFKLKELTVRKF